MVQHDILRALLSLEVGPGARGHSVRVLIQFQFGHHRSRAPQDKRTSLMPFQLRAISALKRGNPPLNFYIGISSFDDLPAAPAMTASSVFGSTDDHIDRHFSILLEDDFDYLKTLEMLAVHCGSRSSLTDLARFPHDRRIHFDSRLPVFPVVAVLARSIGARKLDLSEFGEAVVVAVLLQVVGTRKFGEFSRIRRSFTRSTRLAIDRDSTGDEYRADDKKKRNDGVKLSPHVDDVCKGVGGVGMGVGRRRVVVSRWFRKKKLIDDELA